MAGPSGAARLGRFVLEAPVLPLVIIGLLVVMAVFAPLLAPYSPTEGDLRQTLLPPFWMEGGSSEHLLGTDKFGRDILSRIIFGARVSLTVSLTAIFIGGTVGVTLGIVAGYFGGFTDGLIMRVVDMKLALPMILLALVLVAAIGPSLRNVVGVIAFLLWAHYARIIRGEVLSLRARDFVALAKVAGASPIRIMARHILPNVTNTLIVLVTLQVGFVILLESTLSFLGVGIPPPRPAWGLLVADGRDYIAKAWWVSTFPGIAIAMTVLSLNMLGDWLRDRLDPRRRQRA